jgi:hypothetical protein
MRWIEDALLAATFEAQRFRGSLLAPRLNEGIITFCVLGDVEFHFVADGLLVETTGKVGIE